VISLDIKQLKYFYTIVEEGQITGAAKRLNMAQPPLSYQLKILEDELGVKLVERGSRKIQLTDAGRILYNRAEQILELTESTVKELKDFSKGIEGTLSMGTVSSSGSIFLTEGLKKFHKAYPNINFEISEGNSYKIIELLDKGLIEIGIVRTPLNLENFESIYLPEEPMVAAMTKDLDWDCSRNIIKLEELKNRPLILYRRFEKLISEYCEKSGFEPKIFCKNEDARTTLLWAGAGLGIAILSKHSVKLIGSTNLIYKEIDAPGLKTQVAIIWAKNRYISSSAKHFLEIFI
jgi:DNA-binding transcriptional LysR family regulator